MCDVYILGGVKLDSVHIIYLVKVYEFVYVCVSKRETIYAFLKLVKPMKYEMRVLGTVCRKS